MVEIDVGADGGAGLVEGLVLGAPDLAALEQRKPRLDEGLAFGVAVAAAAVGDAECVKARAVTPNRCPFPG